MRLSAVVFVFGVFCLCFGCGSPPPPPDVIEPAAKLADSPGVERPGFERPGFERPGFELPIEPAQLAQLKQALGELTAFVDQGQSTKARFESASSQGRSRMIQRQLRTSLDGFERPLPFRENLERVVEILSESQGGELSEEDREAIRQEIQAVRDELGLGDSAVDDYPTGIAPGPGPPRPPGR